MNRLFTALEPANAYRLPKHVEDQHLAEVALVEKGEKLILDAHVNALVADSITLTVP